MQETTPLKEWDLEGTLALDFANTADNHASAQPIEKLSSYFDLISWAQAANLLTENEAQTLMEKVSKQSKVVSLVLHRAIELREAIYRIFSAVANESEPENLDLLYINEAHIEALKKAQIVPTSKGFEWNWDSNKGSFDQILWPIAHSAIELLFSEDLNRVGQCADDRGCGWLFYDTSRNHNRRWCSMNDCGNRAKSRNFYKRQTQKQKK